MDFKALLTLLTALLVIVSCKTKDHIIYQSRANIEFKSDIRNSSLEKIELSEEDEAETTSDARKYSVFHGIDNGENQYILFAPTDALTSGITASIEEHQYALSIPFSVEKANELIKVLNSNINSWEQNIGETEGEFSSYNYTPEYETVSISDSTYYYNMPSFSYNFSKSISGNSFSITLSRSEILWDRTIKEKEKLVRLSKLFQEAVNRIES